MNLATTAAVDLARLLHAQGRPARRCKHGVVWKVKTYDPPARAAKKRQRDARKANRSVNPGFRCKAK